MHLEAKTHWSKMILMIENQLRHQIWYIIKGVINMARGTILINKLDKNNATHLWNYIGETTYYFLNS